MDISDYTLIGLSSALVLSSATVIIMVNFTRIFGCCIRKESKTDNVVTIVTEWK
jgi:hypothetical protein